MCVSVVLLMVGCTNTLKGMKEDLKQLNPNLKEADQKFQEKYW